MKNKIQNYKVNKNMLIALGTILILIIITIIIIKNTNAAKLTCKDAENIVLNHLKDATLNECKREGKRYEIEVTHNNIRYEYIVDGNSGEIIEYESDDD